MLRSSVLLTLGLAVALSTGCRSRAPVFPPPAPPASHQNPPVESVSAASRPATGASPLPVLTDDLDSASLDAACAAATRYLRGLEPTRTFVVAGREYRADELAAGFADLCETVVRRADSQAQAMSLREQAVIMPSARPDGSGEALITGYYEPVLEARLRRSEEFAVPVYGVPDDLITIDLAQFGRGPGRLVGRMRGNVLEPYPDRAAIDFAGELDGVAPQLAFVRNRMDAFILHVEGSGLLELEDGGRLRLAYAASNGHRYRSIGRYLRERDLLPSHGLSMDAIRELLRRRPDLLEEVLGQNPSYVFFEPRPVSAGVPGCFGVPLVAHRSVALDRSLFPVPVLAHLQTTLPTADGGEEAVNRFVVMLDTGSAIRGPGRVDLFFGTGREAAARAGRTMSRGRLLVLLPRPVENRP